MALAQGQMLVPQAQTVLMRTPQGLVRVPLQSSPMLTQHHLQQLQLQRQQQLLAAAQQNALVMGGAAGAPMILRMPRPM